MYSYVRPHRLALLAGGMLSLLTGATGLALPLVVRALIDNLGHHRSVAVILLLMTVLVVANAALGALGSYVLRRTAESVVLTARQRLVDRLLGHTISALDRTEPGDLMSRVTSDTTLLRDVTTGSLVGVVTGGQVKAAGTHAELLAGNPLYAELAATQFLASAAPAANLSWAAPAGAQADLRAGLTVPRRGRRGLSGRRPAPLP